MVDVDCFHPGCISVCCVISLLLVTGVVDASYNICMHRICSHSAILHSIL